MYNSKTIKILLSEVGFSRCVSFVTLCLVLVLAHHIPPHVANKMFDIFLGVVAVVACIWIVWYVSFTTRHPG